MSSHAATSSAQIPAGSQPVVPSTMLPLVLGLAGIAATVAGAFVADLKQAAIGWLTALVFWTGISLGMLFLIMITYVFDAGWAVVVRRQAEHALASFKWLFLLFVPIIALTVFYGNHDLIWKWMNPDFDLSKVGGHGTVGQDILWVKKSALLNLNFFLVRWVAYFAVWCGLAYVLRRNSFTQDLDGDPKWTLSSRKWAAGGLALTAITSTLAVIDWAKSLEYHWFSTMYGVWYFANSMRGALSVLALITIVGLATGTFTGLFNRTHLYDLGKLMFAFTVFWAYITFSQYFLIWNANVPEETFWYNIREYGDWKIVGFVILFGHFVVPFLYLLSYKAKITPSRLAPIAVWILLISLIDIYYNILPSQKGPDGNPFPFLRGQLLWCLASFVGVGGIWFWAYLRSFGTTKLIPIRDPRIRESLQHRE